MKWTEDTRRQAAIDGPLARILHYPDTRFIETENWFQKITPSSGSTVLNEVAFSRNDPADIEQTIETTIAMYREHGLPVKWCVGPWTEPADLGRRLSDRGFRSWNVRGMCAATDLLVLAPTDLELVEVDADNLEDYLGAFVDGWALEPAQVANTRFAVESTLRNMPRTVRFFLARHGGSVVGTTGVAQRGAYGYLLGAQILEPHRGRGFYRGLIAARLRQLQAAGITLAVTQAREATSAPMLAHLGFETAFSSQCFVLDP